MLKLGAPASVTLRNYLSPLGILEILEILKSPKLEFWAALPTWVRLSAQKGGPSAGQEQSCGHVC